MFHLTLFLIENTRIFIYIGHGGGGEKVVSEFYLNAILHRIHNPHLIHLTIKSFSLHSRPEFSFHSLFIEMGFERYENVIFWRMDGYLRIVWKLKAYKFDLQDYIFKK